MLFHDTNSVVLILNFIGLSRFRVSTAEPEQLQEKAQDFKRPFPRYSTMYPRYPHTGSATGSSSLHALSCLRSPALSSCDVRYEDVR